MTDRRATREHDEWQLVHAIRRTAWHIEEGWQQLDGHRRRRWFLEVIAGLSLLLAITVALVAGTRALATRGALDWERAFVERFAGIVPVPFSWAIWLESPGNAIVLWPLMLTAAGVCAWRRRPLAALTLAGGFALLDVAVLLGWTMWKRARPDFIAGGVASPSDSLSAFPSGHVSQTVLAYGLLIAFWLEHVRHRGERALAWSLLVLLAAMVAVGRMRLGAHWPSDIVAGAIIGAVWLAILRRALRRGEAR